VDDVAERQGRFSRLTRPFNGLGLPALALPCGFSRQGLPLAFQIVGRPFDEATVLRAGAAYEQAAGWYRRRPALD
jgi:aspartyl-tRNA(Asn)/glutamyl-tRNA(Gln) amidotransferase subunit A